MRSVGVVVDPPFFDDLACLLDVGEQVLVEALVTQSAVEARMRTGISRARARKGCSTGQTALSVTSRTYRGLPEALLAGACFGTGGDSKRIGGHGQGACTLR